MLTVLFASIGGFIGEISASISKFEVSKHKESIYTASFINYFFAAIAFLILGLIRNNFVFVLASLPTFAIRAVLEVVQGHMSILAITKATRSTSVFFANLTIPLILFADLILGFQISASQWAGIAVILTVLIIILIFHIVRTEGIGYPLFTAVNAVFTIQLFKYNITHFNSVEAEQLLIICIMLLYFFFAARFISKENPFRFLRHKIFLTQGISLGIASLFDSFAVSFGNPGIATTAKRTATVLAGIISGHNYFQEKKLGAKILVALILVIGLILLAR